MRGSRRRRSTRPRLLGAALLSAGALACSAPPQTVKPVPIEKAPASVASAAPETTPGNLWTYSSPLPEQAGDWFGDALRGFLIEHRASEAVLPTRPMACVARELGRYLAVAHHLQDTRFQRGVAGACGATRRQLRLHVEQHPGAAGLTRAEALARWGGSLVAAVKALPPEPAQVGVWVEIADDTAWFVLAAARREAAIPPLARRPTNGEIVIAGKAFERLSRLEGIVTRGDLGVRACQSDPTVALPDFRVTCPVTPSDAVARIDVVGLPPGRVLGVPVAEVEVWPGGAPPTGWIPFEAGVEPAKGAEPDAAVLRMLNAVRARAGAGDLILDVDQSAWLREQLPAYRAAMAQDPVAAETIATELMAGRAVKGFVRRARFASIQLPTLGGSAAMISELLSGPTGRWAALDTRARRAALATWQEGDDQWLLIATYRLIDTESLTELVKADRDALLAHLIRLRPPGAPTPRLLPIPTLPDGKVLAQDEIQGVLESVANAGSAVLKRPARSMVIQTHRIGEMRLPAALLEADTLAVSLAYTRDDAFPWAKQVYFIALP